MKGVNISAHEAELLSFNKIPIKWNGHSDHIGLAVIWPRVRGVELLARSRALGVAVVIAERYPSSESQADFDRFIKVFEDRSRSE